MATPKRARTNSSTTTRSKKAAAPKAQETDVLQQPQEIHNEDAIRFRAYQLFEQRGRTHGFDMEDWLRAEGELVGAHSA